MCEKPAEVKENEPTEFSFPRISLSLSGGEYHLAAKAGMTISSYHEKSSSQLQSKPEKDCDIILGNTKDIVGISITDERTRYKVTKVEVDGTVIAEVDIYLDLPVNINISGHQVSVSKVEGEKFYNVSIDGIPKRIPMSEIRTQDFTVDEKTSFTVEESVHLTQTDQVLTI